MKTLMVVLRTGTIAFLINLFSPAVHAASTVHPDDPSYAKWGQLAVKQAETKYNASVLDYLHIGRYSVSPTISEERFKLWLKKNKHEFGVYVFIRFDTASEELISIHFERAK